MTTMPKMSAASRSVMRPTPASAPVDRMCESRSVKALAIYDLLEALGADALSVREQHHVGGAVRPVHRACARCRLLDEDAVAGLSQSEPERCEFNEDEEQ